MFRRRSPEEKSLPRLFSGVKILYGRKDHESMYGKDSPGWQEFCNEYEEAQRLLRRAYEVVTKHRPTSKLLTRLKEQGIETLLKYSPKSPTPQPS